MYVSGRYHAKWDIKFLEYHYFYSTFSQDIWVVSGIRQLINFFFKNSKLFLGSHELLISSGNENTTSKRISPCCVESNLKRLDASSFENIFIAIFLLRKLRPIWCPSNLCFISLDIWYLSWMFTLATTTTNYLSQITLCKGTTTYERP